MRITGALAFAVLSAAGAGELDAATEPKNFCPPSAVFEQFSLHTNRKRTRAATYYTGHEASFCTGFDIYVFTGASIRGEEVDIIVRNLRGRGKFRADLRQVIEAIRKHPLPPR